VSPINVLILNSNLILDIKKLETYDAFSPMIIDNNYPPHHKIFYFFVKKNPDASYLLVS
jgi:hypothetical protein